MLLQAQEHTDPLMPQLSTVGPGRVSLALLSNLCDDGKSLRKVHPQYHEKVNSEYTKTSLQEVLKDYDKTMGNHFFKNHLL